MASRDCAHCGMTSRGPDACLDWLDGVAEACCGHGWANAPYVMFEDGSRLEQKAAIRWFDVQGVGPPPVQTVTLPVVEQYDGKVRVEAEFWYDARRLIALTWVNESDAAPWWSFDGVVAQLTKGTGTVPVPLLAYREADDGEILLPFTKVETVPDGG